MRFYDVIIIGSGISGAFTARECSSFNIRTAVLEKGYDLCVGATRGNSATVHAGHDAAYGSKKAYYNVRGNAMFEEICSELSVPFNRNGYIVFAGCEKDMNEIRRLKENADKNGVPGVEVLTKEQLDALGEGKWGDAVAGGLYAPTGGIVCPYTLTFALCESAAVNGVHFFCDTGVTGIQKITDPVGKVLGYEIRTDNPREEVFLTKTVFNCAGVHADEINNFVSEEKITITPRKGSHLILDRKLSPYVHKTWSQCPFDLPGGGHTKGQGVMPSVDGTIILGCEATDVEDKEDTGTYREGNEEILHYFEEFWHLLPIARAYPEFPRDMVISAFSGIRPHPSTDDFILGEVPDAPRFFNEAGIESPGLTAAPAFARELVADFAERYNYQKKEDFDPFIRRHKPFRDMTDEERLELIEKDPDFGRIVCRCEQVTRAEIIDAILRPVGATTVSGVKMRVRAGMGRCQGGFCSPEVVRILSEELGIPMTEIRFAGPGSEVLADEL